MATMNPTMIPDNQHNDIPGNPSTAKSSNVKLRTEATEDTLRVLTMEQWNFWKDNFPLKVRKNRCNSELQKIMPVTFPSTSITSTIP